jgi:predicted phosphoribosyltransferase
VKTKAFRSRKEAGQVLAQKLNPYAGRHDVTVLTLPSSAPIAYEVAHLLNAWLDVFIVHELRVPDHPDYVVGAIASGGVRVLDDEVVRELGVQKSLVDEIAAFEQQELKRRELLCRGDHPRHDLRGRTLVVVDDGSATGATLHAGVQALRAGHPSRIVVAIAAAPPARCRYLRDKADLVVCAITPEPFEPVAQWYEDYVETTDDEVADLLARVKVAIHAPKGAAPIH